ncbi:MAG: hypothetical protein QHH19_05365 [Candidatus Thermoplasmatota archaeon]|nr:hypothetical protein [Candidatus Thermoplasmatota archaeon]
MSESIEDWKKNKEEYQKKANELKEKRNQLHLKSKKLADERDELNSKIRDLRNKISVHKRNRDDLNERVKHAKEQRNKLNKAYNEARRLVEQLEKTQHSAMGMNLNELKRQLRNLEIEQMTQPMSPQKEKKLIETISDLHAKIKAQEQVLNKDPQLKKAVEEEKILKQKAEKQHDLVEKLAKRAQEEHESMITLIKQLDSFVKRVNEIQEEIVLTKIEADNVHREFIDYVDKIHDLERKIASDHEKKRRRKKEEDTTTAQKEADEIFERFKKGEKLSTEDLMALQKAGLI